MTLTLRPGVVLDEALRVSLAALVARQATLEHVLGWLRSTLPQPRIVEIVVQDEYTHDVVVDLGRDSLVLVYDTT